MKDRKRWLTLIIVVFIAASLACSQLSNEEGTATPTSIEQNGDMQLTQSTEETPTEIPTDTPDPEPDGPAYWVVMQDPGHGFRYAIPCFWEVTFPQNYTQGSGPSYPVRNFTDEYTLTFPRGVGVWESGGMKIDLGLKNINFFGLPPDISLRDLAEFIYVNDQSEIESMNDTIINGQPALYVAAKDLTFDTTFALYLFRLSEDTFLSFSVYPSDTWQNRDILGILNSIALTPDVNFQIPTHVPGPPPVGLAAPCIPDYAEAVVPTPIISEKNTACGLSSFVSLETLSDSIIQGLLYRDVGSLHLYHIINDSFSIGYWESEGVVRTAEEFANELSNSLLPLDTSGLTFTTDRETFPPLYGMPPENMFGPDVNLAEIIYSEGWEQDGNGAALLYILEDECGGYNWFGMVHAGRGFNN